MTQYTLNHFLGKYNTGETPEVMWFFDEEYFIESNPFIKTIDEEPEWTFLNKSLDSDSPELNNPKSHEIAYKTITINNGLTSELSFKVFVTPWQTNTDNIKTTLEREYSTKEYFTTKDGSDLIKNMEERKIISFPTINSNDEEYIKKQKAKQANLMFDVPSTKVQQEIFKTSTNISDEDVEEIIKELFMIQIPDSGEEWIDVANFKKRQ